jgi:two-component system LytT family response regulator
MRPPVIIFTTAFEQFAVQAFERGAVDYLLKPFDQDRVRRALERARVLLRSPLSSDHAAKTIKQLLEKSAGSSGSVRRLAIKSERRISFVETSDIDWVGAADNYVEIHVGKSTHLLRVTLSELEHQLSANRFVRISRSSLINVDKILEIRSKPHGDYEIQLRCGNVLSGSRKFRTRLQQLMTASQ